MNKQEKNLRELKRLAAIENEFKALGKIIYYGYLDKHTKHNFCSIMDEFHERIIKLQEAKK